MVPETRQPTTPTRLPGKTNYNPARQEERKRRRGRKVEEVTRFRRLVSRFLTKAMEPYPEHVISWLRTDTGVTVLELKWVVDGQLRSQDVRVTDERIISSGAEHVAHDVCGRIMKG